jgi:hypothetical protein
METLPGSTDRPAGFLHCHVCRTIFDLIEDEVHVFIVAGWPRCCGQSMTFHRFASSKLVRGVGDVDRGAD